MRPLPLLAIVLGLAGLIPFVAGAVAILFYPSTVPVPRLVGGVIGYGAVILSFLGAVQWGLALGDDPIRTPGSPHVARLRLALGVLPALAGWAAILVMLTERPLVALAVLILGFVLVIGIESRAAQRGFMPRGYIVLRWVLSGVVLLCLAAILLVRLV